MFLQTPRPRQQPDLQYAPNASPRNNPGEGRSQLRTGSWRFRTSFDQPTSPPPLTHHTRRTSPRHLFFFFWPYSRPPSWTCSNSTRPRQVVFSFCELPQATEAMAVRDEAITTGAEKQGDVRKRTAGQAPQANGGYDVKDVKEKTKEKVCLPSSSLAYTVGRALCARA